MCPFKMTRASASAGRASAIIIRSPPSGGKDTSQCHRREVVILSADLRMHLLRNASVLTVQRAIARLDLIASGLGQSDEWPAL